MIIEGCDRFVVVKDFWKIGSAVMAFNEERDEQFRFLLGRCLLIAKPPLQVIRIDGERGLEIYAEYKPYTLITKEQDLLDICISGNAPGKDNPIVVARPWLRDELGPGK